MPEMVTKVEALLADMWLSWSYADAIAKQMWGIPRTAWARSPKHLQAMIAALHNEQKKRWLLASVEELCEQLGINDPASLPGWKLPKNWRRNIPVLKQLQAHLRAHVKEQESHV